MKKRIQLLSFVLESPHSTFFLGHIVLCSHSLRHHRSHPSSPFLSAMSGGGTSGSDEGDELSDSMPESAGDVAYSSDFSQGSSSDLPQIKIKPGQELKLKCDLNNTYGRITWLLNTKPIRTDNGRYAIQGPTLNRAIEGRLTINNVLPEDNGIWQCHETKFDGKEHLSKPIWVVVMGE